MAEPGETQDLLVRALSCMRTGPALRCVESHREPHLPQQRRRSHSEPVILEL